MNDEEWPPWEEWHWGWDVIDGEFTLEQRPIPGLPPHYVTEAPWTVGDPEATDWMVRFPFENGWHACVSPEWFGIATGAAIISGVNARILGPDGWPDPCDGPKRWAYGPWEDPSIAWVEEEHWGIEGSTPLLDSPEHLLRCIKAIATLPSHREEVKCD